MRRSFQLLFWGNYNPNKIILKKTSGLLKRMPAAERFMETEWQKRITSDQKAWPNDTKPSRYHFGGLKKSSKTLWLLADPSISYRDTLGSRPDEFRKLFPKRCSPIPITVTLALTAKNNRGEEMLCLTLRNATQDAHAGGFHITTGGAMEIQKDRQPLNAALRETKEEIGLKPREITELRCRAITYDPYLSEICVIFTAAAKITAEKIQSRAHDNENRTLFISATKNNLEYLLLHLTFANNPAGILGLLAIGNDRYGLAWAKNIMKIILKKGIDYKNARQRAELERKDIKKLHKFLIPFIANKRTGFNFVKNRSIL